MAEVPEVPQNQHPIALRMGSITEHILDFYEKVASPKSEDDLAAVEELFKKYPKVCAAKLRIAPTLLNKVLPNRSVQVHKVTTKNAVVNPKRGPTIQELRDMGLTNNQILKMAGMNADIEEAEIEDAK